MAKKVKRGSSKLDRFINKKTSTKSIKQMNKDFMKTVKSGKGSLGKAFFK